MGRVRPAGFEPCCALCCAARPGLIPVVCERLQPQRYANFLGEVLLNLARLAPYKGHYIEQLFYIKQGKTIVTDEQASGNLKLGLRLDIPEGFTPAAAASPVHLPAPAGQQAADKAAEQRAAQEANEKQAAQEAEARKIAAEQQRRAEEEEVQRKAMEEQRQAAEREKEAQRVAAEQQQKALEAQREAEMRRQAQEAEAQREAEEKQRQQLQAEQAQKQVELSRMRAQEEEMARKIRESPPAPLSPPAVGSPGPRSVSPHGAERPAQARIVSASGESILRLLQYVSLAYREAWFCR